MANCKENEKRAHCIGEKVEIKTILASSFLSDHSNNYHNTRGGYFSFLHFAHNLTFELSYYNTEIQKNSFNHILAFYTLLTI